MASQVWLKTYRESGIPAHIDPNAHRSVVAMLEAAMKAHAGRPAFHSFGQTLTYADVDRQSRHFAAYLQKKLGVKKGDRIAVMMPNLLAFPIAFLGIIRAGAAQVNVNPLYTPRELEHQLKDAGVSIMVVFAGSSATVAEVMASTPLQDRHHGRARRWQPGQTSEPAGRSAPYWRACLCRYPGWGAALTFDPVDVERRRSAVPAIYRRHDRIIQGRRAVAPEPGREYRAVQGGDGRSPPASHDVIVTAIPLYHIFALMVNFITYFSVGADNWLVANPRDMDGFVQTLDQAKPTAFMGVNTLYAGLVAHPKIREVDFSNLRLSGGGGAAVIAAVSAKWQEITGQFIREGYGLSETSPVLTFNPWQLKEFNGTTGLPLPSTDIKLLDDEDREVAPGEAGEICAKGPQVMRGYWEKPEANAAAFTADGYFKTGDVGVFDDKGFLKIVDRKKDMILVSGFNVYPNEIEAVATACPGVLECACIGVPDEKSGEAVKLFVVKMPNATLTPRSCWRIAARK